MYLHLEWSLQREPWHGCGPSCKLYHRRRQALDAERRQLPVWAAREALLAEVRVNRALVVVGETGR